MPEAEQWFTNDCRYDGRPVKRLGINLGAPGDRRASDGTLWLDYPSVGGASPDVPVSVEPARPSWFYHHSSWMHGQVPGWIVGSGAEGIEKLCIRLRGAEETAAPPGKFAVRLYFTEPEKQQPGERVFSVWLQDREVLPNLDIFAETGAANVGLVKEFRGVAAPDSLSVRLMPRSGKTVLCGVEVIAE